jgi:clan AA aspartic protease
MDGTVDTLGRALVRIRVKPSNRASFVELDAGIDTGFTGELVLPETIVSALGLPRSFAISAGLGDGSEVVLDTYPCVIEWFGVLKQIEVIANKGQLPLLGAGLLLGHKLTIDYATRRLTIE